MPAGTVDLHDARQRGHRRRGRDHVRRPPSIAASLLVDGHERARRRDAPVRRHQHRPQLRPRARRCDQRDGGHARALPAARHARRASSCAGAPTSRRRAACASARPSRALDQVRGRRGRRPRTTASTLTGLAPAHARTTTRSARRPRRSPAATPRTPSSPRRPPARAQPTRIWVLGDSGTAQRRRQRAVRDAYPDVHRRRADRPLADARRQRLQRRHRRASTRRRSSTCTRDAAPSRALADARQPRRRLDRLAADRSRTTTSSRCPTAGEAGGVASGTEAYYSFDYGNIHFVCLDSHDSEPLADRRRCSPGCSTTSPPRPQDWIIAFWHHPPYTQGLARLRHRSRSWSRCARTRCRSSRLTASTSCSPATATPTSASFLIDGHYGARRARSSPAMIVDGGDGRAGRRRRLREADRRLAPTTARSTCVAGSSGPDRAAARSNHPAMFISLNAARLDGARRRRPTLDARFVSTRPAR